MNTVNVKETIFSEKEIIKVLLAAEKILSFIPPLEIEYECSDKDIENFTADNSSFKLIIKHDYISINELKDELPHAGYTIRKDNINYPYFKHYSDKHREFAILALLHAAKSLSNKFETNTQLNFEANCACLDIIRAIEG